jgi:hypothetical protein
MHYIFNTLAAAQQYDKDVTALHNYQTTSNWDTPAKHPTKKKWSVECSSRLILEDQEPQELTGDWKDNVV